MRCPYSMIPLKYKILNIYKSITNNILSFISLSYLTYIVDSDRNSVCHKNALQYDRVNSINHNH